jgi:hypothetical protein
MEPGNDGLRGRPTLDITMPRTHHQNVRTTVTLDEDVAAKLRSEARRSGRSFREVVNDTLRRGFASRRDGKPPKPFEVSARDLGELRPGLALDSISDVLEQAEGPLHR